MTPFRSARVDFIRIINEVQSVEATIVWKDRLDALCKEVATQVGMPLIKIPWRFASYYHTQRRIHIQYFDVWGELSDKLLDELTIQDWRNVRRLDWRVELNEGHMPVRATLAYAERQQGKSRATVAYHNSPAREKRYDRDVGGKTVTVGARNTDCRYLYYQRVGEFAALETQFEKLQVVNLVSDAMLDYSRIVKESESVDFTRADLVRTALDKAHDVWTVRKFGISRYQIAGDEAITGTIEESTNDEHEQQVIDFLSIWNNCDDSVRKAIRKIVKGVYKFTPGMV